MKNRFILMVFLSVTVCFAGEALAKELMVFPANGQGEEQMEKDKYECYSWAKKESGFDPMEIPKATEPPPQQQARGGGVVRGAAGGADDDPGGAPGHGHRWGCYRQNHGQFRQQGCPIRCGRRGGARRHETGRTEKRRSAGSSPMGKRTGTKLYEEPRWL